MSYLYNVPCCLWPRTRQLHFVALLAVAVPCGQKSYPVARVQGRDNCTLSPCWHVAVRCPAVLTIIALLLLKLKNRITLQLLLAPCGANFATPLAYIHATVHTDVRKDAIFSQAVLPYKHNYKTKASRPGRVRRTHVKCTRCIPLSLTANNPSQGAAAGTKPRRTVTRHSHSSTCTLWLHSKHTKHTLQHPMTLGCYPLHNLPIRTIRVSSPEKHPTRMHTRDDETGPTFSCPTLATAKCSHVRVWSAHASDARSTLS